MLGIASIALALALQAAQHVEARADSSASKRGALSGPLRTIATRAAQPDVFISTWESTYSR